MKFRIWNSTKRKMIYPSNSLEKNYLINLSGEVIFVDYEYYKKYCCYPVVADAVAMESSYKFDCDSKEIYYGDILRPIMGLGLEDIKLGRDTVINGFLTDYKVIGNIYEGKLGL